MPEQLLTGLPPIAAPDARVLILGSFPSVISLRDKKYYANPQNKFWHIMETLFQIPRGDEAQLKTNGIAVWDVIGKCRRAGSLDKEIKDAEANDFQNFYARHPNITAVFFNGAAAEKHYKKLVPTSAHTTHKLLSTSPANAGYTLAEKIKCWQAVANALKR